MVCARKSTAMNRLVVRFCGSEQRAGGVLPDVADDSHRSCRQATLRWLCGYLLLLALTGCSPWHLAHRTLHRELSLYPPVTDGHRSCRKYHRWAAEAWNAELAALPNEEVPGYYYQGFREGFLEYVFAGGTGQPPPIPPRRFWKIGYRNALGDKAISEWREGYVRGTHAAEAGGYRKRAVVPALNAIAGKNSHWSPSLGDYQIDSADDSEYSGWPEPAPQTIEKDMVPNEILPAPIENGEFDDQLAEPPLPPIPSPSGQARSHRAHSKRAIGSTRQQTYNRLRQNRSPQERTNRHAAKLSLRTERTGVTSSQFVRTHSQAR